jgi:hypothetical protein
MRGAISRHGLGRGLALVAVTAALLVLLASAALAAPPATTWQVSPSSAAITYGGGVILNGTMTSGQAAVGGKWVEFQQGTTAAGSFQVLYMVTTPEGPYATGQYSVAVMPAQTTYYRFSWPGDADYAASVSDVVPVLVKPSLGKPSCPSSAKKDKKFTVQGSVKPGAPGGPAVRIKSYRKKNNGSWVGYKTYSAKVSGTQYSSKFAIGDAGTFKFKASTADSATFSAALSAYSAVISVEK